MDAYVRHHVMPRDPRHVNALLGLFVPILTTPVELLVTTTKETRMTKDPAIEEIRQVRGEISAEFGHDTRALLDHYREVEKRYADRVIRKGPSAATGRDPSEQPV